MASVEVKPKKKKLLGKSVVIGLIRTLVGKLTLTQDRLPY